MSISSWRLRLACSVSVCVLAQSAFAEPVEKKSWFSRTSTSKKQEAKTFADAPARPMVTGPLDPALLVEALKAEQDAYQRRLDVCLKLREIGVKGNDEKLILEAERLERQATMVYHARTARLGVKSPARSEAVATTSAYETLDRTLGTGAAVDPLKVAPPKPENEPKHARAEVKKPEESRPSTTNSREFQVVNP